MPLNEFGCMHAPTFCNDHDRHTVDTCDRQRGCVFTPRSGPSTDPPTQAPAAGGGTTLLDP